MKKLNLDKLENTDDENIQKISDNFRAVSENDISRLYKKTEEKYNQKKNGSADDEKSEKVSVVRYKRPSFGKIVAVASCIVVTAGIITGGFVISRTLKNKDNEIISADSSETELMTPFGDISDCEMRCTATTYVPYIIRIEAEKVKNLSEIFNSEQWNETDEDMGPGDTAQIFVKDSDRNFRLVFGENRIVEYFDGEKEIKYKVSDRIWSEGFYTADPEDFSKLTGKLIPSKTDDITIEGVWKNNKPYPEKMFVPYETPKELEGKTVLNGEPCYDFAYDFSQIENVGVCADNIVTGKVQSIMSRAEGTYEAGRVAVTDIVITVTDDVRNDFPKGEEICISMLGGYISERDMAGEILTMTGGKYGEAEDHKSDEEIENTYYHEIVGSGEVPIINEEYAFFVTKEKYGYYSIAGLENGIFYKCDNLYISKDGKFYDLDDLKSYLPDKKEKTSENKYADEKRLFDSASFDIDNDGIIEKCEITDGPTSGIMTVVFTAYQDGKVKYQNTFALISGMLKFAAKDGITQVENDGKYYRIGVTDGNIVIEGLEDLLNT